MLFDIADLIACISHRMPLEPGDVIATGTPAGVAAMHTPPRLAHARHHRDGRARRARPPRQSDRSRSAFS